MLRHFNTASVNRSANRNDVLAQATKIADLLKHTDVSYVNLREGVSSLSRSSTEPSSHYHQVLKYDSEAFECSIPGLFKERNRSSRPEKRPLNRMNLLPVRENMKELLIINLTEIVLMALRHLYLPEDRKSRRKETMMSP